MESGRIRRSAPASRAGAWLVASAALAARSAGAGGGGAPAGAPEAEFSVTGSVGDAPLTVVFTDGSRGDVTSWAWDFGDGTSSLERNPVHTYASADTYSVTLTVAGPHGSDGRRRTDLVRALDGDRIGIWTNARELARLPMRGAAWNALLADSNLAVGIPNVANQDDVADVITLAKALVYARTGNAAKRQEAVNACMAAIGSEVGARTLALG